MKQNNKTNYNKKMNSKNRTQKSNNHIKMNVIKTQELLISSLINIQFNESLRENNYYIKKEWTQILFPEKLIVLDNEYTPKNREIMYENSKCIVFNKEECILQTRVESNESLDYIPCSINQKTLFITKHILKSNKNSQINFVFKEFRDIENDNNILVRSDFYIEMDNACDIKNVMVEEEIISFINTLI